MYMFFSYKVFLRSESSITDDWIEMEGFMEKMKTVLVGRTGYSSPLEVQTHLKSEEGGEEEPYGRKNFFFL